MAGLLTTASLPLAMGLYASLLERVDIELTAWLRHVPTQTELSVPLRTERAAARAMCAMRKDRQDINREDPSRSCAGDAWAYAFV